MAIPNRVIRARRSNAHACAGHKAACQETVLGLQQNRRVLPAAFQSEIEYLASWRCDYERPANAAFTAAGQDHGAVHGRAAVAARSNEDRISRAGQEYSA
eukprot:TRINITY_DN23020_c0_g1_i2.p6 TRINITY_DN23020_c0_g1~~TRINITY_DN23020_c0_g1_i2.p6  ORF type:complete len:100 (-),score=7.69 TRINITY_DN23020_c0_g1_i2:222-521(-)